MMNLVIRVDCYKSRFRANLFLGFITISIIRTGDVFFSVDFCAVVYCSASAKSFYKRSMRELTPTLNMETTSKVTSLSSGCDFCADSSISKRVTRSSRTSTLMGLSVESRSPRAIMSSLISWHGCRTTAGVIPFSTTWFEFSKGLGLMFRGLSSSLSSLYGTAGTYYLMRASESGGSDPVRNLVRGPLWQGTRVSCSFSSS